MKLKLITLFIALSTVTQLTHAVELYKSRVINHKEWSTGNIKFDFNKLDPVLSGMNLNNRMAAGVALSGALQVANGSPGFPTTIQANQYFYLSNSTDQDVTYTTNTQICVDISMTVSSCVNSQDTYVIEPAGYAGMSTLPNMQYTFANPGIFRTRFSMSLVDATGVTSTVQSSSFASIA